MVTRSAVVAAAFAALGLSIACRSDRSGDSAKNVSHAPTSGAVSRNGFDAAPVAPDVKAGGDATRVPLAYLVDRIDEKDETVFLTPARGLPETTPGTSAASDKQPVAGHELVLTFAEIRALTPAAQSRVAIRDLAHTGDSVNVIRDASGNVTQLDFVKR